MANVGKMLSDYRKKNGYSVAQAATLIGVSAPTLSKIEKGGNVTERILKKIYMVLDINVDKLSNDNIQKNIDKSTIIDDDLSGVSEENGFSERDIADIHSSEIPYTGISDDESDQLSDSFYDDWKDYDGEHDKFTEQSTEQDDKIYIPNDTMFQPMSFDLDRKIFNKIQESAINMASQSKESLRCLVSFYYQYQGQRIANNDRINKIAKKLNKNGDDSSMDALRYLANANNQMELQLKKMLGAYSLTTKVGQWMNDIIGIGPCLSAGLLAYFSIDESMKSVNSFYQYAGLNDNNVPWLSKTDVTKIMDKAHEIIKTRCDERIAIYESFHINGTGKMLKQLATIYKDEIYSIMIYGYSDDNIRNSLRNILTVNDPDDKGYDLIGAIIRDCKKYEYGPRTWYNTLVYKYNNIEPSPEYLMTVAVLANRTYKNIFKGSIDNTKKGKGRRTYDRLDKFLCMPPYRKELKVLCFRIEDSFVKQQSRGSIYGKLYRQRKEYEIRKNERGDYRDIALKLYEKTSPSKRELREFYSTGKLTGKHIDRRARRWACKIFISHLFDAMYIDIHGRTPDLPKVFNMGNHLDFIAPEVPYSKYWKYEDTRNLSNVSLEYTPDYTYSFNVDYSEDWADVMDRITPKKIVEDED